MWGPNGLVLALDYFPAFSAGGGNLGGIPYGLFMSLELCKRVAACNVDNLPGYMINQRLSIPKCKFAEGRAMDWQ